MNVDVEVDVAFSGVFRQPLARVWHALTADGELCHWFDTDTRLYLEPGGALIASGGTQFQGAFRRGTAREISPGRHILWEWPLGDVVTFVTWTLVEEFGGTRLDVRHRAPKQANFLFAPQELGPELAQFWTQNIVCLKVWLDLGFPPERSRFGERPTARVQASMNIPVSPSRVWSRLNESVSGHAWCFWPLQEVKEVVPGQKLLFCKPHEGSYLTPTDVLVTLEGGHHSRDCLVRVESCPAQSVETCLLHSAHERWLTALHVLGVFAVTGEPFQAWCVQHR